MKRIRVPFIFAAQAALLAGILASPSVRADYETCTAKNGYLESSLVAADWFDLTAKCSATSLPQAQVFTELDRVNQSLVLPTACVLESMKLTPETGYRYGTCDPGASVVTYRGVSKPCVSSRRHFYTYLSFLSAMTCLGADISPRELFPIINQESNFQLNIGSSTGAWGIGQLTPIAIKSVNLYHPVSALLDKEECQPVKKALAAPMSTRNPCEWVSPPDNPTRNFIYAGLAYLSFRDVARGIVRKSPLFAGLRGKERKRVTMELTLDMYNGGDGGIRQAFKGYEAETSAAGLTAASFKTGFRAFLKEHYGETIPYYQSHSAALAAKRGEVAGYASGIEHRLKRVERAAGAACGE